MNVKLIRYQFCCTRCAFWLLKSLQWCLGRKSSKSGKKCENWKSCRMKTKQSAMNLSQIRQRIELCLRNLILRFEISLQNLLFSWRFNSYSYFKASAEVLSNWAVETLGDWKDYNMGSYYTCTVDRITFYSIFSVLHGSIQILSITKQKRGGNSRKIVILFTKLQRKLSTYDKKPW
jgi:hypothetical protein